jgi:hypothetical protein
MTSEQIPSIAQSIVSWLVPFFPYLIKGVKLAGAKWFEALGEKGGEEAIKKAEILWNSIKTKSSGNKSLEGAALILSENPENQDVQQMLAKALAKALQEYPELVRELETLRKIAPSSTVDQRSGGVYFSGSGKTEIRGSVIGGDQTQTGK